MAPQDGDVQAEPPLLKAARKGLTAEVHKLLVEGADVNQTNASGETALIIATEKGEIQTVLELLTHKDIDVNQTNAFGQTALMLAALNNNIVIVAELLKVENIKIDQRDRNNRTALIYAGVPNHVMVVELFLNYVATQDGVEGVEKFLKENRIAVNQPDHIDWTLLMYAVDMAHTQVVTALLRHNDIDIDRIVPSVKTPMELVNARLENDKRSAQERENYTAIRNMLVERQKLDRRLAVEKTIFAEDKTGKLFLNPLLVDPKSVDPNLINQDFLPEIFAFAGVESKNQEEQRLRRAEKTKRQEQSAAPLVDKISNLIGDVGTELINNPNKTEELKSKITKILKEIQRDAEASGYILQARDENEMKNGILSIKKAFPASSEIADKLQREWNRMVDEYNKSPVEKMLAFIKRLKCYSYEELSDLSSQEKIKAEINERMESLIADNQYCSQEADKRRIDKAISEFENKFSKKEIPGFKNLVTFLKEKCEILIIPPLKLHTAQSGAEPPVNDSSDPAVQAALMESLKRAQEREQKARDDALQTPPPAGQARLPRERRPQQAPSLQTRQPQKPPKSRGPKPP